MIVIQYLLTWKTLKTNYNIILQFAMVQEQMGTIGEHGVIYLGKMKTFTYK